MISTVVIDLVAWNNEAVHCIIHEKFHHAIQQLQNALAVVISLSRNSNNLIDDDDDKSHDMVQHTTLVITTTGHDHRNNRIDVDDESTTNQPIWKQHCHLAVYDRPCSIQTPFFSLSGPTTITTTTTEDECNATITSNNTNVMSSSSHLNRQISLIMLYNLGLSFHLCAMNRTMHCSSTSTSSQKRYHNHDSMLNKALDLYNKALLLVHHQPNSNNNNDSNDERDDDDDHRPHQLLSADHLITLLLYNNMACIYREQLRLMDALECLQILEHHLQYMVGLSSLGNNDDSKKDDNSNTTIDDAITHCYLNILIGNGIETVCAPAG